MHTYIHTHIHTYIHTLIHLYIHTCMHTYIHTYIHTHNQCEWHRMTRMTGPDCAVMCNLINIHTYIHTYCLDIGACLKVNTRALGRGALYKKDDSIPLLLKSERHTGRACEQLFTRSVSTIQYSNHIYIPNSFST